MTLLNHCTKLHCHVWLLMDTRINSLSLLSTAAGDAYCSAAKLHRDKLDTRHEAANNFADAAAVYRKVKPEGKATKPFENLVYNCVLSAEAITCYQTASEIYTDMVSILHIA